jgi:hypothetical protein
MQRTTSVLIAGVLSIVASQSAQAQMTLGERDFGAPATGPLNGYSASSYYSAGISATPGLSTSGGSIAPNVASDLLTYTFGHGTGHPLSGLNGCTFTLSLTASAGNYSGLSVSFAQSSSLLNAGTGQGSYLAGGGYTAFGSGVALTGAGGSTALPATVTLSAGQTLGPEFTMSGVGAISGPGSLNYGSLEFNGIAAVPEPVNVALAVFGVLAVVIKLTPWRWHRA